VHGAEGTLGPFWTPMDPWTLGPLDPWTPGPLDLQSRTVDRGPMSDIGRQEILVVKSFV
jgi:hypothetical protein